MAIHEDGTMDVLVDGRSERRRYSINVDAPFENRYIARVQSKYAPELREGEEAMYMLDSDTPVIVCKPIPIVDRSYDDPFFNRSFDDL